MQVNFPMKSWGPHPSSDSEKKLNLSLCLRPQNNVAKGNLTSCSYRLKRKARCTCKYLLFFNYLVGMFRLTLSLPSPSLLSLLLGFIALRKLLGIHNTFLVKMSALFSLVLGIIPVMRF